MTKILRKLFKMGRKMEEKCWNDIIWIIRIWKKKKVCTGEREGTRKMFSENRKIEKDA